ncbi:MAG: hypothetical protein H0X13_15520 [Ramlibacter sp.]|nr:hypothetical protein [Ramlibacter sp.]
MKLLLAAVLALAATTATPQGELKSEPQDWAELRQGQAVKCTNAKGCIIFSREAFEAVVDENVAMGAASCRRKNSI